MRLWIPTSVLPPSRPAPERHLFWCPRGGGEETGSVSGVFAALMTDPYLLQFLFSHFRYESKLSTVPSIASPIRGPHRRSSSSIFSAFGRCFRTRIALPSRLGFPSRRRSEEQFVSRLSLWLRHAFLKLLDGWSLLLVYCGFVVYLSTHLLGHLLIWSVGNWIPNAYGERN